MKVLAIFAAFVAVSSAQIIYSNQLGVQQHLGYSAFAPAYAEVPAYAGVPAYASAPAVVAAPAVPVATKTQYHAQDELGQASFGHSQPGQAHAAVRDAAGGVSGTFSYISPEGIPFTTHYRADHNGYRVASNALPVAPSVAIAGPVDTPEVHAAKIQHAAAHADALVRAGRRKRQILTSPVTYATAPALTHSYAYSSPVYAAPAVHTVAAAPFTTYSASPVVSTYSSQAVVRTAAVPAATVYSAPAVVAPALRHATLTRVVNTPGHAVSYRVD